MDHHDDRMRRGFAALPADILLAIAALITDLGTLHRLLRASPAFRRLFDTDGHTLITIIDGILNPMPEMVQAAARISFRLRAGCLSAALLKEKPNLVCTTVGNMKKRNPGDDLVPDTLADVEVSPSEIHRWLALAERVEMVAHNCLQTCLEKCREARPTRLRDPSFRYPAFGTVWNSQPEGDTYEIPPEGLGPPSWIEQQRALRMAWLLDVSSGLGDPECKLVSDALSAFEREQLWTVKETLMTTPSSGEHIIRDWAREPTLMAQKTDVWEECRPMLKRMPLTWTFYTLSRSHWASPIECGSFAPYRRLGFAMWDRRRMTRMGFLGQEKARCLLQPAELYFTWRSLLTPEEDEQVRKDYMRKHANTREM